MTFPLEKLGIAKFPLEKGVRGIFECVGWVGLMKFNIVKIEKLENE